jgi:hypothetical protein
MQGWLNICELINVIQCINRIEETHKIIFLDAEKDFDKIQYHFMIKSQKKKLGTEGSHFNIKKSYMTDL